MGKPAHKSTALLRRLQHSLAPYNHADSLLLVAYSGGLDSTVLAHALAQLPLQAALRLVHVHHGLQAQADDWLAFCQRSAAQLGLPFQAIRIDAGAPRGQSPEAAARAGRYRALADCMASCMAETDTNPVLLTAHHQDDQAETLLLQLLRGAGAAGLAAMPEAKPFARGQHLRPLLGCTRAELHRYAREHQLSWVEDPSNQNQHFDRNYIRHSLMPQLQQRWPAASHTLARSASLLAEQNSLLNSLLKPQLAAVSSDNGAVLSIARLRQQPAASLAALLRLWLQAQGVGMPSRAQLQQIMRLLDCAPTARGEVAWGAPAQRCAVRYYAGSLYLCRLDQERQWAAVSAYADRLWQPGSELYIKPLDMHLNSALLAWQGIALPSDTGDAGDTSATVQIKFAQPQQERLYLPGHAHSKRLKNWFQEQRVPPWQRPYCPLLYVGDKLRGIVKLDEPPPRSVEAS